MVSLRLCLILPSVVLLASWVIMVDGIKCYQCSSTCDSSGSVTEGDCPADTPLCIVIKYDNGTIQQQSCGTNTTCANNDKCKDCSTELCNHSSSFQPSFYITIIGSILAAKMFMN